MLNTTINGYTIRRHIGSGNFGDVYLGENRLGVRCALKVLQRRYIEDRGIVHRFEQEAHAMCRLDHPNVRRAIDLVWIDGVPAILMEYLEGHTLKDLILSNSCSDRELRGWFVALGTALMQLHRQRIIHRDIKPANIFITTDGTVKLLDFGIAKVLDGPDMSLTGSKLGTLIYSSPEQVRDPRKVGVQTDIYSLAVTFHHAVTGRLPYDRNTLGEGEITIKIVQQDLSMDHLPRHWQQALSYCLHKDAEKRDLHKAILQVTGGYDSKLGGGRTNETELDYGGDRKTEFETDPQRGKKNSLPESLYRS